MFGSKALNKSFLFILRAMINLENKLTGVETGHDKLVQIKAELDVEKQKNGDVLLVMHV